ncbi:MAG: hypothetical protein NTV46_18480 [Verrucomicrobia bacterium]|nr:hypothetical protein [Verrucomicrobiota bacterium]
MEKEISVISILQSASNCQEIAFPDLCIKTMAGPEGGKMGGRKRRETGSTGADQGVGPAGSCWEILGFSQNHAKSPRTRKGVSAQFASM